MCYDEEYVMLIIVGSKKFYFCLSLLFYMMNTRIQTRAHATASSSRAATQECIGIRFKDELQRDRFYMIKNREVKTTKWACPIIFNQLCISNEFTL